MSIASVSAPFRPAFGDQDWPRGHRGAARSKGRYGVCEPLGVIPRRTILAVMGAPALLSERGGGGDDAADGQERLQLQKRDKLVVVTPALVRDADLLVPRRQLADLGRGFLEAGRLAQGTDVPPHQAPQLASNGSRLLGTRRSVHDHGHPAPLALHLSATPLPAPPLLLGRGH